MNRRELLAAGVAGLAFTALSTTKAQAADPENPDVAKISDLLNRHDAAMTNHDIDGVLACLSDSAAIMGSGPGEMWKGNEEIKTAYKHFLEVFDKGQQSFEYLYSVHGLTPDMGWWMTSGNVKAKKDGKDLAYPLNISLTVAKDGGDWKIAAMHFSTLVSA